MIKNKLLLLMLCMFMVLGSIGLMGCSNGEDMTNEENKEAADSIFVELYYANEAYITTGDESLDKLMPAYESKIPEDSSNVYVQTLEALKIVPDEGYETLITENIIFNDVYVEDDTVFVDLSSNGLNGGSLSETFLISQIVETLTHSFKEIEQVQFLVDGEVVVSLMGHIEATEPFRSQL